MAKLRKLSGREIAKALTKLGFRPKRQKGSHLIMIKETPEGKAGCVVPMHKELKIGTIRGVLRQAGIKEEEFIKYLS